MQDQTQPPIPPPDPVGTGQAEPPANYKPYVWRYGFIVLGVLQVIGIALYLSTIVFAPLLEDSGVLGLGFIIVYVLFSLVPVLAVVSVSNLVALPVYMLRYRPQGRWLVLGITSLAISLAVVLYGGYQTYASFNELDQLNDPAGSSEQASDQSRAFADDDADSEITKQAAIELLQTCQLESFYYTDQNNRSDGNWGELSSTGVVLTNIDGVPDRISIADNLIPELVPIARDAQKMCDGSPQFWHDGAYETYENG